MSPNPAHQSGSWGPRRLQLRSLGLKALEGHCRRSCPCSLPWAPAPCTGLEQSLRSPASLEIPLTNPPAEPNGCVKGAVNYASLPLPGWLMSRNKSALGRAEIWEVWIPVRATLVGKHFPSKSRPWGRARMPPAHRRRSRPTVRQAAKQLPAPARPPRAISQHPQNPVCSAAAPGTAGGRERVGGYSSAAASSEDGQTPHKGSGTELAPLHKPHCGRSCWDSHSQEKPCRTEAGKHLARSAPSGVPELPMLWWRSLQTMATQEGAKPPLNFRGAGIREDQPSPLPPRQASQAARDRQQTVH